VPERPPKGHWLAVTDVEQLGGLRLRLYECYDGDEALIRALVAFHSLWWDRIGSDLRRLDDCLPDLDDAEALLADQVGLRAATDYFREFRDVVANAGLDRIGMVGTPPVVAAGYLPSGSGQAHRFLWHLDKALLWERAVTELRTPPPLTRRPTFVTLSSFGAGVPAVDRTIAGTSARWDPRTELLAHARRRLHDEKDVDPETIEAELGRIAREGSYRFPDTSTRRDGVWRLDRDALWVFWRIRRRLTYVEIAREWDALHPGDFHLQPRSDDEARKWDEDNPQEAGSLVTPADAAELVRKAVKVFAVRAGVDVRTGPGRRPGGRPRLSPVRVIRRVSPPDHVVSVGDIDRDVDLAEPVQRMLRGQPGVTLRLGSRHSAS
jgi:hypothetical protein